MNWYEQKRAAKVERLRERAAKKEASGLDLYGEAKSGIPMGQPILIGHHSERRHRRHLERIENRVRKGFQAHDEAIKLRDRADSAESRTAIDSDNPDALMLLCEKLKRLEKKRNNFKATNVFVRSCKGDVQDLKTKLQAAFPEFTDPLKIATELLTKDFAGRIGIPNYVLTNLGAEIRRLKKRIEIQENFLPHFASFTVNDITVELIHGQVQVEFPYKPNEATRQRLKTSPLALKWSSYSGRWVRKHTAATAGRYFRETLENVLKESAP